MKINIILIFVFLVNIVNAQSVQLNPAKSSLKWTGKAAFNAYALSGNLKAKNGKMTVTDKKLTESTIVIDMKSLNAENKDLAKHLRGKDFFEVKKHTTATFRLSKAIDLSKSTVNAKGKLTIKGITKEYTFPLTIKKVDNQYKVSGTLNIDRTDFKIYYNSPNYFEGLKQQAIADEFKLKVDLVFE